MKKLLFVLVFLIFDMALAQQGQEVLYSTLATTSATSAQPAAPSVDKLTVSTCYSPSICNPHHFAQPARPAPGVPAPSNQNNFPH